MMGWSAATAIRMARRYGHIGSQSLPEAADVLGRFEIPAGSLEKSPKSVEVENGKELAPQVGLEPTTLRLTAECSAIELLRSVVGRAAVRFISIIIASPTRSENFQLW